MNNLSQEQQFIATIHAFEPVPQEDLGTYLEPLSQWQVQTISKLSSHPISVLGLKDKSIFSQQVETIQATIQNTIQKWDSQWQALAPAQSLANTFDNKIILLVFGKFNAGKSSFCNLIAQRFADQHQSVHYFSIEAGQIVPMSHSFKEGSTETTAQIQGVVLSDQFVLLDTPGLHSITTENATLTKHFTDSADAMLWLTSSGSPGQVQELEEAARELHRQKPLLPIITRSDFIEEDEIDGEIKKCLRNKTADNRKLQECDVKERSNEKLMQMQVSPLLLKDPVSISVYAAKEQGLNATALSEAGFERLYAALHTLIEPALIYKKRKPAYILLHHLEENVLGSLNTKLLPLFIQLEQALTAEQHRIQQNQSQVITTTWRAVIPSLPELLEKHENLNNNQALFDAVSIQMQSVLSEQIQLYFTDYVLTIEDYLDPLTLPTDSPAATDYEALYTLLEHLIHDHLKATTSKLVEQCTSTLKDLMDQVQAQQALLMTQATRLEGLKNKLNQANN